LADRNHNPVLELACELIRRPSVTPDDAGCQELLGEHLQQLGFALEPLNFGEVRNLWAVRGQQGPLLVFAGHTDVVPSGPPETWTTPPFEATLSSGYLYGRGAADMKTSLAAMVVATQRFIARYPDHLGRIGYLITSDEEGPAIDGTRRVMAHLTDNGVALDYCIVGEPSSESRLGDTIRVGRRGSINAQLTVVGSQGHVAYPALADNPVHAFAPALVELASTVWDDGNDSFPPSGLQISNVQAGTGATNVIPGTMSVAFNLRYNTEQTSQGLRQRVVDILNRHELNFELEWTLSGEPFLTAPGELRRAVTTAISRVLKIQTDESTSGGTSDGRFIAPSGCEVVELGPINATIHKIDERVALADLVPLADVYEEILIELLT
jgi:succinyl-diaminopimelate desuccinylase